MVFIYKNNLLAGRLLFSDTPSTNTYPKSKSQISQNTLLHRLRPSRTKWKLTIKFQKFIRFFTQFFTISRPNVMKEKIVWVMRAGGSKFTSPTKVSFGNLWTHYQRFLKGDGQCSPMLMSAMQKLEKDEALIKNLAIKKNQILEKTKNNPQKQKILLAKLKKEEEKFVQKNLNEISNMKSGQSRLFVLNREMTEDQSLQENLFCIITKQQGEKYTLRFLGNGEQMKELNVISLGGKDKVLRELCFENIPKATLLQGNSLKTLFTNWIDFQPTTPKKILEDHPEWQTYQKKLEPAIDLMTVSDRSDRLFWNIVKAFPNQKKDKPSSSLHLKANYKQIKLRADILTLFDLFQNIRYDLKPHTADYQNLLHIFKTVSAKVDRAYQKGIISQEELKKFSAEFTVIEKALQNAKKTPIPFKSKLNSKPELVKGLFLKNLPLRSRENISITAKAVKLVHRNESKKPLDQPVNLPGLKSIPQKIYYIPTKKKFLKTFNLLFEQAHQTDQTSAQKELAIDEIIRFFSEVYYYPFDGQEKDSNSFWWDFTKEEALEVMKKMDQCTKTLIELNKQMNPSQYEFESYLQMGRIVEFLNARVTGKWLVDDSVEALILFYLHMDPHYRSYRQIASSYPVNYCIHKSENGEAMKKEFEFIKGFLGFYYKNEDEPLNYTKKEFEYVIKQRKFIQDLLDQKRNKSSFDYLEKDNEKRESIDIRLIEWFFNYKTPERWLRPITNLSLMGLYKFAISQPVETAGSKFFNIHFNGLNTPEAFHHNPEEIFNFFSNCELSDDDGRYQDSTQMSKSSKIQPPLNQLDDFTAEEKKSLLRLMRKDKPQVELLAFMKENPHLMVNPDVRNFFDALFFGTSLAENVLKLYNYNYSLTLEMPQLIDEEIQIFEGIIDEALKDNPAKDPENLQSCLDTLLYYYEMKEKLRDCYKSFCHSTKIFTSSKQQLKDLIDLCQTRAELKNSLGYAARVHLRVLLANHTQADIPEIIKCYALSHDYTIDKRNIDPAFEGEMHRQWQIIAKHCEENNSDLQPFLDLLCYAKNLPVKGSAWKKDKKFIYSNGTYQVNLQTLHVTKMGEEGNLTQLPLSITQHPDFKKVLGNSLDDQLISVQEMGSKKSYSFIDQAGRPMQIDWNGSELSFYTQLPIDGSKWLQILPENPFQLKKLQKLKQMQENNELSKIGVMAALKMFLLQRFAIDNGDALSALSNYRLLRDPDNPHSLYCLDQQGHLALQLNVKDNPKGLTIESVVDHRTQPLSTWQINLANSVQSPVLERLFPFEHKEQMLFWSQQGKLKKIELPRYQLSFMVQGDQLLCTEPFKGYSIDLAATLNEKKGISQALVLKHPNPEKGKKLIVPQAEVLVYHHQAVLPKAKGFGKIRLIIQRIVQLYQYLMRGQLFKIEQKLKFGVDANRPSLTYTAFDLRPFTNEICPKKTNWEKDVLQLVKIALKNDQAAEAWQKLNLFQLKPNKMTSELIQELMKFIQKPLLNTGGEAALKLKLALQLKDCLKKNKQWKAHVKQTLHQEMLKLGPVLFAHGRKIPLELQLSKAERIQIARLFKKNLPDYFNQHLKPYFVKDGTAIDLADSAAIQDDFDIEYQDWKKGRAPIEAKKRIEALETDLTPDIRLSDDELSYSIPLLNKTVSLIEFDNKTEKELFAVKTKTLPSLNLSAFPSKKSYEKQALEEVQTALKEFEKQEKQRPIHTIKANSKELEKILNKTWIPAGEQSEKEIILQKTNIEMMIRQSKNADEQMAIFSGSQPIASWDELRQALAFDDLDKLKQRGRLPSTIDVEQLKHQLIQYYIDFTRRNAYKAVIDLTREMLARKSKSTPEDWDEMSEALYRLLTIKRNFDPYKDPRLLIFTAQQFINLKPLDGGLEQLALLESLIKNPYGIIQAPTGAGKTAVLSVMRTLHKANGKNLVIQKVLSPLYQQTYDKFKDVLGDLFGTSIYALRFNLKMRLSKLETKQVKNDQGVWQEQKIEHSIFKEMYLNLLETMQNKGCVLTDYKSLPLLEEMFFKVGQELLDKQIQGVPPTPLQEEHFNYLKKILILLENKADENMDEFDQPNRPIQKIQLDLAVGGSLLPDHIFQNSLEVYEMLLQDPELKLQSNIQSDLTEETRQSILHKHAQSMAKKLAQEAGDSSLEHDLNEYILGKNENILLLIQAQSPAYKDRLALMKDQFSIYLPLTLRYKQGSRYMRSDDGSKTLPAYNGEKHEAKFGTPLEQINYTIQDYLQSGITFYDLKPWVKEIKQRWQKAVDPIAKQAVMDDFQNIFPNLSIPDVSKLLKSETKTLGLINEINQDTAKITHFLHIRLRKMKTSGNVISMDPQNNIDMSRVVSAVSATMGAPESLHRQFQVNQEMNGQIQANMVYRVKKRASQEEVIAYDPAKPKSMLPKDQLTLHAIIDGAGAFKDSTKGAKTLKKHCPALEQVGYHREDGSIVFAGKATGELDKTGFFFSQSHTRGTDISLASDAEAILTLTAKDGIREVFQKEGRLRQNRQRYLLAMPKYQGIKTVTEEIAQAIKQDAAIDAKDIFRKCKQEPRAIVRKAMKKKLLETQTIPEFLKLFGDQEWKGYFISSPESTFKDPGSYFAERQHIQLEDQSPGEVLNAYKTSLTLKAKSWGLSEAVSELNKIYYSDELLTKMPEQVAPLGAVQGELEEEVEVEQEEEMEAEQEMELEFETETQQEELKADYKALGSYPVRLLNLKQLMHSVTEKINSAYDPLIYLTEAFMPYSRQGTASLHQRKPFDETMYRIGTIYFDFEQDKINKVIVEDPLEDSEILKSTQAAYDIRTNSFVGKYFPASKKLEKLPQFISLIAQIKFLDGRLDDYSPQELQALSDWLKEKDAKKMKEHLLNEILCYRYQEKQAFAGSQIEQLFEKLIIKT